LFYVARVALQAVASSTNTTSVVTGGPSGKPLLLTVAEVAIALAVIAIFGTMLIRVSGRIAVRAGASKSASRTANQLIVIVVAVAAIAVSASLTGVSSEFTTLTISGIGGLAVTLALQTTLSNIIAGLLMFQDGVLRLDDDIEFGTIRGKVVKLSLRTTWLMRQDGVIAVIGNSNLASGPIINYTAKDRLERKLERLQRLETKLQP